MNESQWNIIKQINKILQVLKGEYQVFSPKLELLCKELNEMILDENGERDA